MRYLATVLFVSTLAMATPAAPQIAGSWGGRSPAYMPGGPMSSYSITGGPNSALTGFNVSSGDYWARCIGGDNVPVERSIRSCGRVIGARESRVVTAAAHYYRAKHYEELGDTEAVQRDYERALELFTMETRANPTDAIAFFNRAGVLAHFHEYDRAIADYRQAAALNADWDKPYYRTGGIAFERGDYAAAIAEFDRAAELNPEDPYNQSARCEARAAAGSDFEGAEAACAEALNLAENDSSALVSRGYLRFMQGNIEAAYADFDAAATADAENLYAVYGRGVAGTRLQRQPQAEIDLTRASDGLNERERSYYANAGLRP
jgi:tetratricopeptide (TPR) repeat protein